MNDEVLNKSQKLFDRFNSLKEKGENLSHLIRNEKLLLEKAEKKHAQDLGQISEIQQGIEALKLAIVPLTEQGLQHMKDLVSFGLGTIFFDELYALDIEIQERGNDKTAELWLVEGTGDDVLKTSVRDSIGDGVRTVIALILRIFFILHYKQRRIVMMDEPFSDVATKYLPGLFKFIRYTVEELGFRWLIVTHDVRFYPYVDTIYRVHKGAVRILPRSERESTPPPGEDGAHA